MKKITAIVAAILVTGTSYAQVFLNGDFENNTASACDYNNTDPIFNMKVPNVVAFGGGATGAGNVGETDIQTFNCFGSPQSGSWCLGLASDTASTADAVALRLSADLIVGQSYRLTFYVFGNTTFGQTLSPLKVGLSAANNTFGTLLCTALPDTMQWKQVICDFTATQPDRYVTVTLQNGTNGWNQIDNFTLSIITGTEVDAQQAGPVAVYPNPATDLLRVSAPSTEQVLRITLSDATGRQLHVTRGQRSLDLSSLAPGFYLVEVETSRYRHAARVVKQ